MRDVIWHSSASDDSLTPMGYVEGFPEAFVNFWQYVALFVPKRHDFVHYGPVFTTRAGNLR